jgi:hypothetical protein
MVLFQFLEVIGVFGDYPWIEYLCHAFIMPSTTRNSMSTDGTGFVHSRVYFGPKAQPIFSDPATNY